MHILLIEPDAILTKIYCQAFTGAGHTVVPTGSAQTAVHLADEKQPDVVVLELQLARHNGIEFLYEFRSYHEWLKIPVIINSHIPPQEFEGLPTLKRELGVAAVLHKSSADLSQLLAAVAKSQPIPSVV